MKYNFKKATTDNVNNGLVEGRNTSLNGHLGILYDEIIEIFGAPTWSTDSEAHRTRREWELIVELGNGDNIGIDIYDYKDNEKGFEVDEVEAWHVASERTSTEGVEGIDAVAILQQIVQDHRSISSNEYLEDNDSYVSYQLKTRPVTKQIQEVAVLVTDIAGFFKNSANNPEKRAEHNSKVLDSIMDLIDETPGFNGRFSIVLDVQDLLGENSILDKIATLPLAYMNRLSIDLEDSALTGENSVEVKSIMANLNKEHGVVFNISKPKSSTTINQLVAEEYASTAKIDVWKLLSELKQGNDDFKQAANKLEASIMPAIEAGIKTITYVGVDDDDQKMILNELISYIYQNTNTDTNHQPEMQIQGFVDMTKTTNLQKLKSNLGLDQVPSVKQNQTKLNEAKKNDQ